MHSSVRNGKSKVVHAITNKFQPWENELFTLCGFPGIEFLHYSVAEYHKRRDLHNAITCKNCRRSLGLPVPMFKTIRNDSTDVIHAEDERYYTPEMPVMICVGLSPSFTNYSIARYECKSMRDSMVTCKNCLRKLGLPDGRRPSKPKEAKSIFDTIATNKSSGIAHAVFEGSFTECGLIDEPFQGHILSDHNSRTVFERSVTCRSCRRVLKLTPLPKKAPKKAKWVANYLGDTSVNDNWGHLDENNLEFEMSVCREDYTDGRKAAGWYDLNKKIVIFDSDGYSIESEDNLKWMKQVVEAMAAGLNAKGL